MIHEFISAVKTRGLAKSNRFRLTMPVDGDAKLLQLYCESCTLPGLTIATDQDRIWGESRDLPYGRIFSPLNITFHVDAKLDVKKIFEDWQNKIVDPKTRTLGYYNAYVRQIQVEVLNMKDEAVATYTFYEAYPKIVNDISLDNNSKEFMKLGVQIMYRYYTSSIAAASKVGVAAQDPISVSTGTGFASNLMW